MELGFWHTQTQDACTSTLAGVGVESSECTLFILPVEFTQSNRFCPSGFCKAPPLLEAFLIPVLSNVRLEQSSAQNGLASVLTGLD
jgi:hypothetical protein